MEYKDHPDVKVDTFNPKIKAIWKDMPAEYLNDLPTLQSMLNADNMLINQKYEQLLIDNNVDPNMHHMAMIISDQNEDDFVKNRITIYIYPRPNKPQSGND